MSLTPLASARARAARPPASSPLPLLSQPSRTFFTKDGHQDEPRLLQGRRQGLRQVRPRRPPGGPCGPAHVPQQRRHRRRRCLHAGPRRPAAHHHPLRRLQVRAHP
eukprot:XP_001698671.1 THI4 regulatory protein [Chlamydomonas reinhardtii]